MKRFDLHDWHPQLYKTVADMNNALKSLGIKGKKIRQVHTIGLAQDMHRYSYVHIMRNTLASVGIPYKEIDSGRFPRIDSTLIPCQVSICEPVVFILDDGTTFEIKPEGTDGIYMSVNQISPSTVNGTNNKNFNSDLMFNKLKGAAFKNIEVIESRFKSTDALSYECTKIDINYQFELDGDFGFSIMQSYDGWFKLGLTNYYSYMDYGKKIVDIPYINYKRLSNNLNQIPIVEGHDSGGYFWIMPVKHTEETKGYLNGVKEFRKEEISIDELDIGEFLYYFLIRYFDEEYPYKDIRGDGVGNSFEWNLEYNIYTYETVNRMLADIEHCSKLLKTDYDNPELDELKKRFSYYTFDTDENKYKKKFSARKEKETIRNNINLAVDFYDRFILRMKSMMKYAPDYNLISFMGP